jgi:4-hydroxythreonine-4-phosphate dehydrogenase
MKKIFAIIAGEPNSINSEIIAKSWKKNKKNFKNKFFIIGSHNLFKKQLDKIGIKISLEIIKSLDDLKLNNQLKILDIPLKFNHPFKINNTVKSNYIFKCFDIAHNLALTKKISGFINAPVNKRIFKNKFLGVTEYLAYKNKLRNKYSEVMCIYNKKFSVVPITTHIDINKVATKIKSSLIERKVIVINSFFLRKLKRKPKIAILGLNPHNSENKSNSIESLIIKPAIKKLMKKKIDISGPYAADTIFTINKNYRFDVIIGMYHDQVLGPFKALFGFDAINITLGLKYLRISPDHGTAENLIKLNKSNPLSLINSIKFLKEFKND